MTTIYDPGSVTTAPSAYPNGISVGHVTTGNGWPVTGTLTTTKRSGSRMFQTLATTDASMNFPAALWMRYGVVSSLDPVGTWGSWVRLGQPSLYDTGDSSEKSTSLPVPTNAEAEHRRVIYSQYIPDLAVGDILQVMSEFQVTNDLGYNVMCVALITLTDSPSATFGTDITEINGRNVTPGAHHDTYPKVGAIRVTSTARRYVNVIAYAASTRGGPGATIAVDQDYGRLTVIRH